MKGVLFIGFKHATLSDMRQSGSQTVGLTDRLLRMKERGTVGLKKKTQSHLVPMANIQLGAGADGKILRKTTWLFQECLGRITMKAFLFLFVLSVKCGSHVCSKFLLHYHDWEIIHLVQLREVKLWAISN